MPQRQFANQRALGAYAEQNDLAYEYEYTPAFAKWQRLLSPEQYEIVEARTSRGVSRVMLRFEVSWARSERFVAGYGSFPRAAPRIAVIRDGRVNPVQLAGLDCPLAKLIPTRTDPARLDASQDRRFRHADFRGLPGCCAPFLILIRVTMRPKRLTAS
jgi:hypothetical protein